MELTLKRVHAAILLVLIFVAPVAAGPLEDASVAYSRGDYATVLRLMRPLADQGDAVAQHDLGVIYENGLGVPQNYDEAVKWYHLAAEQGYGLSQFNLGLLYDKGRGVSQNDVEAVKWYSLAANQSNAAAQVNLGVLYAQGRGVKQDYVRALMWFNLSAAQGEQRAVTGRDMAARRMTSAQIAEAQKLAREWRPKTAKASPVEITPRHGPDTSDPTDLANFDPFSVKPKAIGAAGAAPPHGPVSTTDPTDVANFDPFAYGHPENKTSLASYVEGFGGLVLIAILAASAYWMFKRYATGSNPFGPQVVRSAPVWSRMLAAKTWLKERYDQAPDGELEKFHDRAAHRDQDLKMMELEMTDHQQLTSLLERAGKFAQLTTPKAILVASIILVAGILFLFRYELTPIQNAGGVIRLDRLTGTISFCRINASMEYGC